MFCWNLSRRHVVVLKYFSVTMTRILSSDKNSICMAPCHLGQCRPDCVAARHCVWLCFGQAALTSPLLPWSFIWWTLGSSNLRLTNSIIKHYYHNDNLPSIWLLFKLRHREPPNIFPSQVCFYKKLRNKTIHQLWLRCEFPCLAGSIINSKMRGEGVVVVGRESNLFVITGEDTIRWL